MKTYTISKIKGGISAMSKLDDIDKKLYRLEIEMKEIWELIDNLKKNKNNKIIKIFDERNKWKKNVYRQIKMLINTSSYPFNKKSEVLHYIYNYMRRNYSIVWEQDIKEYKMQLDIEYNPNTIDVVYENKMYRSIFEAILIDLVVNANGELNLYFKNLVKI